MWIEDRVNEIKNNAEAQCRPEEVLPQVLVLAAWTLLGNWKRLQKSVTPSAALKKSVTASKIRHAKNPVTLFKKIRHAFKKIRHAFWRDGFLLKKPNYKRIYFL